MEFLIGLFGIALFLLPLILALINTNRVNTLMRRLQQLEMGLLQARNDLEEMRKGKPATAPMPAPPQSEARQPVRPVPVTPPAVPQAAPAPTPAEPGTTTRTISPTSQPAAGKKSRTGKEWEALIGGKILNRIGALALIIGVGFFLKYAFDNDWISETVRVLLGAMAGGGLLYVANRAHAKGFQIFSQGLVGAGIAILYLSVYAAFNFYQLVPQWVAFALMSVVTMITLWQSLKYDSLAVALLGWAGGFLTPFMLSTGSANEVGLFTYIGLLVAGLLSIAISKKRWMIIEPLTLAAAYFIYFLWFDAMYVPEKRVAALFFLSVFWILFVGFEAFRNVNRSTDAFVLRHVLAVANGVLYYIGMYQLIEPEYHQWMGVTTLLIAAPYAALFLFLRNRGDEKESLLARYALGTIALVFSATAIQFSGFTTVIIWSIEALACVYAGSKWNMRAVWAAAVVMFTFTVFKLFFSDGSFSYVPLEEFRLLFNMRALTFIVLGAALMAAAHLLRKREERFARRMWSRYTYTWCVVFFVVISGETIDLFSRWRLYAEGEAYQYLSFRMDLALSVAWMAYSVLLAWIGFGRNIRPALHAGVAVLIIASGAGALTSLSFSPIQQFDPVFNYRVLTLALLVAGMVAHFVLVRKHAEALKGGWLTPFVNILGLIIVAFVLVLLTSETRDFFQKEIHAVQTTMGDNWTREFEAQLGTLRNMQSLSLSGVWLLYSVALMVVGLWKRHRNLRIVAIGLFGISILKIFIYDLSFLQTLYRIFSFMGLGVILLGVSYLYQKYKGIILEGEES